MTRIPDLEQELLLAARRRFAPETVPARGRRLNLAWLRPRVLVPVAAALLAIVVAGGALRGEDPEIEAPAARYDPSARPSVESLLRAPWRGLIGRAMVDPRFTPVTMRAGEAVGAEWMLAVFAGSEGRVCATAVPADRDRRLHAGGSGCSPDASVSLSLSRRQPTLGGFSTGAGTLVYGVVDAEAREVRVATRRLERRAELSRDVFTRPLDGVYPGGERIRSVRLRLYAAVFTDDEVRAGGVGSEPKVRVTYADGRTVQAP